MVSRFRPRPTVREVAAAARVSPATVSNVMNGTGRMSADTRSRVLDAARELGYGPWTSVRAGNLGGTGVIGLTLAVYGDAPVDYLSIAYYRHLVLAATSETLRRGYLLLVLPSSMTSWGWMSTPLDGVIHTEPRASDPVREILLRRAIPMVSAGRPDRYAREECWVDSDSAASMVAALDHLWDNGSRRPALLLPEHDDAYPAQLAHGCDQWTARSGVGVRIERYSPFPVYAPAERAAARRLLEGPDGPDGVVGVYENSGHHVLDAARDLDRRVPEDVRVVCISENPEYERTDPPVTTVVEQAAEIGRESVDLLLDLMHGRRIRHRQRLVTPVLHPRGSSEAAPAAVPT